MADFYPVAPLKVLQQLRASGDLRRGALLLAHDMVKHEMEYYHLLLSGVNIVIVDNGTAEFGVPVDISIMEPAVQICSKAGVHTVVVLPDVYEDTEGTIKAVQEALAVWPDNLPNHVDFMVVPQGTTEWKFIECCEAILDLDGAKLISWWGIPRNVANNHGSRTRAIELCHALNPEWTIHLLGFSDNVRDDVICARSPYVNSIDSSVPCRAAFEKRPLRMSSQRFHGPEWWEMEPSHEVSLNVRKVSRWVRRMS